MTTGQRIRAARKKRGFTQSELAEKLGIPYQSIGQWERDVRNPKFGTLMRIADALDMPVDDLTDITWEETKLDAEGAKRARQYSDVQDLILEVLKVQYGAAERKELSYNGLYQNYFLVGIPPEQFLLHNADLDALARVIPALVERMRDTRPVDEILADELNGLKSRSEYMDSLLKEG